jgi:hypothetical protein
MRYFPAASASPAVVTHGLLIQSKTASRSFAVVGILWTKRFRVAPVEVRKTENLREPVVERCPVTDTTCIEFDDWILHEFRFSNPLIKPESI